VTPWVLLDTAELTGDGGKLRLLRRGAEFSIRLGHNELMNSRVHVSEEALAKIALAKIGDHTGPRPVRILPPTNQTSAPLHSMARTEASAFLLRLRCIDTPKDTEGQAFFSIASKTIHTALPTTENSTKHARNA